MHVPRRQKENAVNLISKTYLADFLAAEEPLSAADLAWARMALADATLDRDTLELLCLLLFAQGDIAILAAPVERLLLLYRADGLDVPEQVWRVKGYVDLFRSGILVPPRRAPRTRTLARRVLGFYHAVPPFHTSGYAVRTHELARAAARFGTWDYRHHSRIGYPWDVRGKFGLPADRITRHDGIAYIHDRGSVGSRGSLYSYIQAAPAAIRRAIYTERPAVVHAASAFVNALPALIAARAAGVPFVYEVRGLWEITAAMGSAAWESSDRFRLEKAIETLLVREADGVIAITEGVRRELVARGADPARTVLSPNGISEDSVTALPRDAALAASLGLDPSRPTLGYIGSFVEYEGLEMLIEAAAALWAEGLEFNVLLVGDGPGYRDFNRRLDELGLRGRIALPGRIPHEAVSAHYALIDIAVFPRLPYRVCELVSPLKPLEALLLGKLVIGSSVGGIREIVAHGRNGLIFEAGNREALVAVLRQAIADPDSHAGLRAAAARLVREERSWRSNIQTVEALFETVTADAPGAAAGDTRELTGGQLVTCQVPAADTPGRLDLAFRRRDGSRLVRRIRIPPAGDRLGVIDAVAPAGAVALESVGPQLPGMPPPDLRPLETLTDLAETQVCRVTDIVELDAAGCLAGPVPVVPGTSYGLGLSLLRPASQRDQAIIAITFHGAGRIDRDVVGLAPLSGMPETAYAYVRTDGIRQDVFFRVPEGTDRIGVLLRQWSARKLEPVALASALTLVQTGTTGPDGPVTLHLVPRRVHESRGPARRTPILLGERPVTAAFPTRPGRSHQLQLMLAPVGESTAIPERAAVLAYRFIDTATGAEVRAPGQRYSEKLGSYYGYVQKAGENTVPISVPQGADLIEVSLQRWNAPAGSLACSSDFILQEQGQHRLAIAWNLDQRAINILLFADLNINLVDGSAVWLVSMANALSRLPGSVVHLLLRHPLAGSPFAADLNAIPNCRIIDPLVHLDGRNELASAEMGEIIARLDAEVGGFDHLVVRGFAVNHALSREARLHGRLCPYLTDIPQQPEDLTDALRDRLELILRRSGTVFLQSRWLIDFVAGQFPLHADKLRELPPMIDRPGRLAPLRAGALARARAPQIGRKAIVYAGKLAPEWGILELFEAFDTLRADDPEIELHIIGSKIHNPPENPDFRPTVMRRLLGGDGLTWHGEVDRQAVLEMLPRFAVGWSWRDPEFEERNRELSTKLLEYGQAGLPAVLTATGRYRALLGADYPFLAASPAAALDCLRRVFDGSGAAALAVGRLQEILGRHGIDAVALQALQPVLPARPRRGQTVLLATHDPKFAGDLQARLIAEGYRVIQDPWKGHSQHDEARSTHLLQGADIVFCEWALGNLRWYADHAARGQRVLARLHAQELLTDHLNGLDWERVEKVIFVSEAYRDKGIERFAIPPERTTVIPNAVNMEWFRPDPAGGRRKRLGLLGIVPWLKRPDLAVEILARLLHEEPGYSLSIKGHMPADYSWMRNQPEEMRRYRDLFGRILHDPALAGAVEVDPHGHDTPLWAGRIDVILSTSDRESFHLATAEAAAVGASPVILPWEGADRIYPADWIVPDVAAAVARIRAIAGLDDDARLALRRANSRLVAERFSAAHVTDRIIALLRGGPG